MNTEKPIRSTGAVGKLWCALKQGVVVATFVSITGCATTYEASGESQIAPHDTKDFPYNPVVFHLDLSIFAYQLYAQTLVWPFDPYYEDQNNWDWDRSKMLDKVRAWSLATGTEQTAQGQDIADYRGPGGLNGFDNDPSHDPILYRYNQLNPWSNTITRANGFWTESRTPQAITDPVREMFMCTRPMAGSADQVSIEPISPRGLSSAPNARDVILAFEGQTGDKGEPGQAGSQSMLGYALVRHWPDSEKFDVHIAFRGSRSGSPARAFIQALSDGDAKGNPDWITDLGYDLIGAGKARDSVTTTGKVFRGFAHSMAGSSPQIFGCLDYINTLHPGKSPERIFVTGHSLGGGLAQHFVSTVLMGGRYGPDGAGDDMSASLQKWPWQNIKLVSFAAPRSGDKVWAKKLTETHLQSDFFSTLLNPFDSKALAGNDPAITDRLLRTDLPAGYRVLISRDPITTGRGIKGKHVGKTVYVNKRRKRDIAMLPDVTAHEPLNKRRLLLESLDDPKIPRWDAEPLQGLVNDLIDEDVGSKAGYAKLKIAYEAYYRDNNIPYNNQAFDRDYDLFLTILEGK
jgi:hypothetical protein